MPDIQHDPRAEIRNLLIRALPHAGRTRLLRLLEPVGLPVRTTLARPDEPVDIVHFIETGSASLITLLADGMQVEVGLVRSEGFIGLPVLLGEPTSSVHAMVQIGGTGLRISAARFRAFLIDSPSLMTVLLRSVATINANLAQTAACSGRHRIEERLARWVLMTHDRVEGDQFLMTQEFMSRMLEVATSWGNPGCQSPATRRPGPARPRHHAGARPPRSRGGVLRIPQGGSATLRLAACPKKDMNAQFPFGSEQCAPGVWR